MDKLHENIKFFYYRIHLNYLSTVDIRSSVGFISQLVDLFAGLDKSVSANRVKHGKWAEEENKV